ncbi:MAG: hypothetical protein CMJ31_01165 [Phycisphaerae bacterium]|nr:hypothetical protein [Phycisphaerae bacterium]
MRSERTDDVRGDGLAALLRTTRRGSATIWAAISVSGLLVLGALVVDGAVLYSARGDLQAAADSAALAGASALTLDPSEVRGRAIDYASRNTAAAESVELDSEDVELGDWDYETEVFTPLSGELEWEADAVRVTARRGGAGGNPVRTAFARMFSPDAGSAAASAIAVYRPREIVLVLDLSGSMCDDSRVGAIPSLGRAAVEAHFSQMWQELGSPSYGYLGEDLISIESSDRNWVVQQLGLNGVPYPYRSGSWVEYVRHVMEDGSINREGYRRKYGALTLLEYWQARRQRHDQTEDLAIISQQPLTAVKDAVELFVEVLREEDTDDRLALAVYNSSNEEGLLEHGLTRDFQVISGIARNRQAGHYNSYTNISAGMDVALDELDVNARPGTHRTIVLLTDGQANRPGSASQATARCIEEAQRASMQDIPILTISLGTNAQTDLMQDIADLTSGIHFNIPGGSSVEAYEEELRRVFRRIAVERPLRLVR